ncbi:MAG: flagellar hook basal-body protein [Sulfobacillus thermotolerans]|nr:flagellar hook basal-body protein [Sulfobacillus thermotolerans]
MFSVLHAAQSGIEVSNLWLNAIASNVANNQTPGYGERLTAFSNGPNVVSRAAGRMVGSQTVQPELGYTAGAFMSQDVALFGTQMMSSSNPHDVAINGSGFFQVKTANGTVAYTRDGSLQEDGQGQLTLPGGSLLDPPVTVPPGQEWAIAPNGTVMAGPAGQPLKAIGTISLALFANPEGLISVGHNLYQASLASGPAILAAPGTQGAGTLEDGALNGSGVSLASQLVDMIVAQTAYSASAKVMSVQETLSRGLTQITT